MSTTPIPDPSTIATTSTTTATAATSTNVSTIDIHQPDDITKVEHGGGKACGAGGGPICSGCNRQIVDRFMLLSLDKYWHEECLKCQCCNCRLGEVDSKLYFKQGMMLCARDYLRLFGLTGMCSACNKNIPAFEMVMRAGKNVYHLECFACHMCNHRFCVGDKFYLCENKILCEYDYEERMTFLEAAYNNHSLAQMRRNIQQLGDLEEIESLMTR